MATFDMLNQPESKACRLIAYASAKVVGGFVTGTFVLIVEGQSPCANMQISLVPVTYAKCPEYWEIELVGCLPNGNCLTQTVPFTKTIDLMGITGSKGVTVVGANKREQLAVTGGCKE